MTEPFSYDRLPYPSKFFVQTSPDRLATNAAVFGMEPVPVETCRVLELGCGNGSNLLAQAYLLPNAVFVGIDLSSVHIDAARKAADELGLSNIEFRQADVTEMSRKEYGGFDYIVAHGLFSWVPDPVRSRVLALNRELLNENGVGYISYSAFPGAHYRQMVQRILRHHTRRITDPKEKVEKALGLLNFLVENTSDRGVYRSILETELLRHRKHDISDIFHDDLSETNQAFYFHEFAALLGSAGLQFLGEAELHAIGTYSLTPAVRSFVESFEDVLEREQYLDLVRGRIFRQTLFVHKEVVLQREIAPGLIDRFRISSSLRPTASKPDLVSERILKFSGTGNAGIEIDQPLVKAVFKYLADKWALAVPFPDLIEEGKKLLVSQGSEIDDWEPQVDITRSILMQIALASNMVELHLHQPIAVTKLSRKPKVGRLARFQMKGANNILTGLNLDMKIEDAVSRQLLQLMDGTRTRNALFDEMGKFIRSAPGVEDRHELIRGLPGWLDESLANLARIGVFEG